MNKLPVFSNSGFTLIELIIVIVILGILSVVALPRFIDISGDANASVVNAAAGSAKSAATLFKMKTLTAGKTADEIVEFSGITGRNFQPWVIPANAAAGDTTNYALPPEIFEAAGLNVEDWAYRMHFSDGSFAIAAAPKNVLALNEPTLVQVQATNCYFQYHWKDSGDPLITTTSSGC